MIRSYVKNDIESVLAIWLEASVKAHDFIEPVFWESKLEDMRTLYIPSAETYVYEEEGNISGFYCLNNDTLAAIFVVPGQQGKGIGSDLLADAKLRREQLELTVYKSNTASIGFYQAHGFSIESEQADNHTSEVELLMKYQP